MTYLKLGKKYAFEKGKALPFYLLLEFILRHSSWGLWNTGLFCNNNSISYLVQFESTWRQQFKCGSTDEFCFWWDRKQYRKRRKMLATSIFSFSHCLQQPSMLRLLKLGIVCHRVNTLLQMPILGSSDSAANKNMMSKTWTNGVQLSDLVENVGKEEIAHYKQFLFFPQCFQKLSDVDA